MSNRHQKFPVLPRAFLSVNNSCLISNPWEMFNSFINPSFPKLNLHQDFQDPTFSESDFKFLEKYKKMKISESSEFQEYEDIHPNISHCCSYAVCISLISLKSMKIVEEDRRKRLK